MTNLNIVELIEKNPITKLTNDNHNKLLTKIRSNFTSNDQQTFLASFYCYLNYNSKNDFVIDLDNVWKWLGFNQKYNAKRVLEKHFIIDIDYKNLLLRSEEQDSDEKKHGGHNKETFMLTISAFKRFCLKAGTTKADQIHEYYIKLEETLHEVINEESNELKLQLEQVKTEFAQKELTNKITFDKTLQKEKELEKHKLLLREFGYAGSLFYIIRVKSYDNGEYVVKVGESRRGSKERFQEHKQNYEEAVILDCFLVKRSKDFETFIKDHDQVRLNNVKDLPGHETATELFLIGKNLSYAVLLNIIKTNINYFNEIDYDMVLEELDKIKSLITNQTPQQPLFETVAVNKILEGQCLLLEKLNKLEKKNNDLEKSNKEILEKLNASQKKITTGFETPLPTVGPRLQKISPDTLQIVKIYETVTECMKEDQRIKRPSVNQAALKNVVYCGFRWALIDRELDPNVLYNLQPTVKTRPQNLGYIAKLNTDKSQILNVYLDRKTAALSNGYDSSSALDTPVKNNSLTRGHYYMLYDNCADELREDFETRNHGEPVLYKDGVGQFDAQNNMTREFICKYDCLKQLKMSDKTLAKALDKNIAYNGFYYKTLGSKTQCF
jgi:phage anti-repressor protein